MSIDYEDIKSEWLPLPREGSVEFKILKDATKVLKTSNRTGNPYPSYEFSVESSGERHKWSTLLNTYRQMVNDAGRPASLVGSRWRYSHSVVNGGDSYVIDFLGFVDSSSPTPEGGGD